MLVMNIVTFPPKDPFGSGMHKTDKIILKYVVKLSWALETDTSFHSVFVIC